MIWGARQHLVLELGMDFSYFPGDVFPKCGCMWGVPWVSSHSVQYGMKTLHYKAG